MNDLISNIYFYSCVICFITIFGIYVYEIAIRKYVEKGEDKIKKS